MRNAFDIHNYVVCVTVCIYVYDMYIFLLSLTGFAPPTMPPMVAPPGAPSLPGQVNIPMRPPPMNVPATIPGSTTTPTSAKGAPSMAAPPAMYQANPVAPTSGGYDSFNVNAPAPESNQ